MTKPDNNSTQTLTVFELTRTRRPDDVGYNPAGNNLPVIVARYPTPPTEVKSNHAGTMLEVFIGKECIARHAIGSWDTMTKGQLTVPPTTPALAEVETLPKEANANAAAAL